MTACNVTVAFTRRGLEYVCFIASILSLWRRGHRSHSHQTDCSLGEGWLRINFLHHAFLKGHPTADVVAVMACKLTEALANANFTYRFIRSPFPLPVVAGETPNRTARCGRIAFHVLISLSDQTGVLEVAGPAVVACSVTAAFSKTGFTYARFIAPKPPQQIQRLRPT